MQVTESTGVSTPQVQPILNSGVVNARPEDKFDRLTRIAKQLFELKWVYIALLDGDCVWLKSKQGPIDFHALPRNESFTTHTIAQNDILEVTDTHQDARFKYSRLVQGSTRVRYYAGAPIVLPNGHRIGALCVAHDAPCPPLAHSKRQTFLDLAACVAQLLGDESLEEESQALRQSKQLADVIARAQRVFIQESDREQAFETLLNDILTLTNSAYGFVSDVLYHPDGQPYMKTHAITNISWDKESGAFYDAEAPNGMEFSNLKTLFGAAMASREVVIANRPRFDPRSGGLPPGHPPLHAFLGIPIHHNGEMIALLGLANRPGGYDQALVDFLQPLRQTIGHLVSATRVLDAHERVQNELTRLSRVASETTNSVIITDPQGLIEWVNDGFTRLTGYELDEVKGRKPGHVLQGHETASETVTRMRTALNSGESFIEDVLNYRKDGQAFWVRLSCNLMRDSQGNFQGAIAIGTDITREKSDAERIKRSEQRLAAVIDGASIATMEWHIPSGVMVLNERWAAMLGYTLAELKPCTFHMWQKLIHPDDWPTAKEQLRAHFDRVIDRYDLEYRMRHKNGHWVWIKIRGAVTTWTDDGKPCKMFGTQMDISSRQEARIALEELVHYTQAVLDNIVDGLITFKPTGEIVTFNSAAERIFGYSADEVIGTPVESLMPSHYWHARERMLQKTLAQSTAAVDHSLNLNQEMRALHKDGHAFPAEIGITQVTRQGQIMFIGLVRDISTRKAAEQEIERLAFYDPLTKLPNRRLLIDRLQHAISTSKRTGQYGALLFLDLDNFKNLNDTAGHAMGDTLLQQVSERLQALLREGDTVARFGGDEFVVILEGLSTSDVEAAAYAEDVVEKIHCALSKDYQLGERHYQNSSSIGVTMFANDEHALHDLLKEADMAMYQAKEAGRNTYRFFDPTMQSRLMARTQMEADLRKALAEQQFELFYQSQVDGQGRITGAEALLRWRHPERGMIPPNLFIPIAEETGLIVQIGQWVLEAACDTLVKWAQSPETENLVLAINISAIEFKRDDYVDMVKRAIARSGIRPHCLELELTETMLVSDLDLIIEKMSTLRDIGVSFSMDDFGTGYSSLSFLKRLPLNQLKIDQSFVREICNSANDAAIARTIISLGMSMGLEVIAEGVETSAQRSTLSMMGCRAFQGYLFGPPKPLHEWLKQQ